MNIPLESRELSTGIFWYDTEDDKWLIIDTPCDLDGNVDTDKAAFNAKSGTTYNHEKCWKDVQSANKLYKSYPYNYFPRGRVMIHNNIADVYYNPYFNTERMQREISSKFGLSEVSKVRWHVDNSNHYQCLVDI